MNGIRVGSVRGPTRPKGIRESYRGFDEIYVSLEASRNVRTGSVRDLTGPNGVQDFRHDGLLAARVAYMRFLSPKRDTNGM